MQMRSNFRHLYADIFWFGVLAGSAMAFLAIYAARLGATSWQISLLTAGPAVVNLIFSLPAGGWLAHKALIPSSTLAAALQRSSYLAFAVLPWLLPAKGQIWAVVGIVVLTSVPQTVLAISFNSLFAEVVPAEARGEVMGKRNALMAISMTVTTLVCGQLLDRVVFPGNYQIVFGLGALGAGLSTYHLSRLQFTRQEKQVPPEQAAYPTQKKRLAWFDLLHGPFGYLLLAYLIFYSFQYLPLPLFPLTFVKLLHLTDGQISLGSALFYGVMLLLSLRLNLLSARFGHRRLLVSSAILFGVYPLLLGLARDASLYWVASVVGGGVWALLGASAINLLMERAPSGEFPTAMALHNLVLNLGILAGSLSGAVLIEWIGLREALLVGAGLRFLAGFLILVWS
jgi:MFS family permease